MKISEYKNEEALDLLAEIIEPATAIMTDKEIQKKAKEHDKMGIVKHILKNHKPEIIAILAALDGVEAKNYTCNVLTLPIKILEIVNDKEMADFFTSQEWTEDATAFTVPTENITAKEQ